MKQCCRTIYQDLKPTLFTLNIHHAIGRTSNTPQKLTSPPVQGAAALVSSVIEFNAKLATFWALKQIKSWTPTMFNQAYTDTQVYYVNQSNLP